MAGPYEGVHSFIVRYQGDDGASPDEIVGALADFANDEDGPVFFASKFTPFGDNGFIFLAHVGVDGLVEQSNFYNSQLWDAGVQTDSSQELDFHTDSFGVPMAVKRHSPTFCAIARVKVNERPRDAMEAIATETFGEQPPFVGISHVTGRSPLLIELGAESFEELESAVEQLRNVGVVKAMQASWVDLGSQGA
jgi:hypothetical protein